jgi:hypothetical protein
MLLDKKEKYDYLIIDGLSDLDTMSEMGGTLSYMKLSLVRISIEKKISNGMYGEQLIPKTRIQICFDTSRRVLVICTLENFLAQVEILHKSHHIDFMQHCHC